MVKLNTRKGDIIMIKDNYYVVNFEHIDDYRCFRPLIEVFDNLEDVVACEKERQLRSELNKLFLDAGWEGDGEINCIFMPPCFVNDGYTTCEKVYHVKQSNNGTSWLAIPNDMRVSLPEKTL